MLETYLWHFSRPTIIDFARLFSRKRALLQCVRVMDANLETSRY